MGTCIEGRAHEYGPDTDCCLQCGSPNPSTLCWLDRLHQIVIPADPDNTQSLEGLASQMAAQLDAIEGAIDTAHARLDDRQHGGVIDGDFRNTVEALLSKPWVQGASKTKDSES